MKNDEQKTMALFLSSGMILCFALYLIIINSIFSIYSTNFSFDLLKVLMSESPIITLLSILPLSIIFISLALGKQKIKSNFLKKYSRTLQAKTEEQFITINKYQDVLAAISNETDQAIIIINKSGQIELVNKAFQNTFEFNYNTAIGKKLDLFFCEANLNLTTLLTIKEKSTTKKTFNVDFFHQNNTIHFVAKPILSYKGEIEGLVLIENKLKKVYNISKLA